MERNPRIITALETVLKQECALYSEYLKLLEEERDQITKFNTEKVHYCTARRAELSSLMEVAREKRTELLKHFPQGDGVKLSEILARHGHPDDVKRLLPLVMKLKSLINLSQKAGTELSQVVSFSLRMINGSMSLLWSAKQGITKLYERTGLVKEKYHPGSNRALNTLKQA